jgi:hypothetical protein
MVHRDPPSALIVSRDASDALAVQAHFQLCEIRSVICTRVEAPGEFRSVGTVVVFPDDFSALSSAQGVRHLVRRFPLATVIIVTLGISFFETLAAKMEEPTPRRLFVLPPSIWGWAVLDRILASRRQVKSELRAASAAAGEGR